MVVVWRHCFGDRCLAISAADLAAAGVAEEDSAAVDLVAAVAASEEALAEAVISEAEVLVVAGNSAALCVSLRSSALNELQRRERRDTQRTAEKNFVTIGGTQTNYG